MSPTSSSPRRPRYGPTVRQQELEDRIISFMESSTQRIETKVDVLTKLFTEHVGSEGHELLSRRVKMVEDEVHEQKERPVKTWQIVAGVLALIFSFSFVTLDVLSFALNILIFIRSLH